MARVQMAVFRQIKLEQLLDFLQKVRNRKGLLAMIPLQSSHVYPGPDILTGRKEPRQTVLIGAP